MEIKKKTNKHTKNKNAHIPQGKKTEIHLSEYLMVSFGLCINIHSYTHVQTFIYNPHTPKTNDK